jgi:hypothetical protein
MELAEMAAEEELDYLELCYFSDKSTAESVQNSLMRR